MSGITRRDAIVIGVGGLLPTLVGCGGTTVKKVNVLVRAAPKVLGVFIRQGKLVIRLAGKVLDITRAVLRVNEVKDAADAVKAILDLLGRLVAQSQQNATSFFAVREVSAGPPPSTIVSVELTAEQAQVVTHQGRVVIEFEEGGEVEITADLPRTP